MITLRNGSERLRRLVGPAVLRVARVQMHDGRAGFRRADRRVGDLLGVTGRCGDIDGVWIAPVTAQVMMTLFLGHVSLPRCLARS